jgi:hypothetical protein
VVASRLAEQLAQLGLVDQSAIWYFYARQLYLKTGLHADPAFALGATSEFLINGHPKEAGILSGDYVKAYPEAADGWFILLSSTKDMLIQNPSDTDAQASNTDYLHKCSIALINRLQRIRLAAGDKTATTRPIASDTDATLPDVSGDTAMLAKSAHIPGLMDAYIGAASALAWLDIYYRHDTAGADPLLKVLAQVASPKDVTLRRLQAWQKYLGGDPNGALPQLQALSSEDPLSAMGAILIELTDPAKAPTAIVQAQKLLNEHPAGVIGAVLWSELGDKNHLSIDPAPDSAQIATLIADVPDRLLQMVDNARTFYIARLDAVKPSFEYGEPILLRVTLQNISNYNIAIGDECAIHPNVWIDGFFRGQLNSQIPGGAVAIGRIDQRLALAPSESTSTVVRVDSDLLNSILNENGTFDVTLDFSMVVNPGAVKQPGPNQTEQTQFGACGYSVRIQQMIERTATPIEKQEQRDQILERLQDPDGGNKIRVMEALTNFIAKLRETNNDQYEKIVTDFNSGLKKAPTDGKPAVQAWKQYELAMLQSGDDQVKAVGAMAQDNNWQTRLLALVECQALGAEGISLADSLFTDREPIVRDFAKATAQSLAVATTQPTTPAPAAQGANNP